MMIAPATSTLVGGVKLKGILGGGTANLPNPPNGYITAAMLADSYALASALTAETTRAQAAEAALTTANNSSYQAAINYTNSSVTTESAARVAAVNAIWSTLNTLESEVSSDSANIGAFYATLNTAITNEVNNRESAISALGATVTAVNAALNSEIARAEGAENARLVAARNFSDLTDIVAARANLGLGDAALRNATDFDAAGAAAAVQALLVAETSRAEAAESSKLAKSNNLADVVSASTARTNLGLGSAATHSATDFDAVGISATETARAEAAEALLAPLANTVTLSGVQTVSGNKNFTGTLSRGGSAVVTTDDSRLSDARNPLPGSVSASSVANATLTTTQLAANAGILLTQLAPAVQTSIALANSSVQTVNGHSGPTISLIPGDIGAVGAELYTTKGDILAAGGADDPVHVAVGADGMILTADSSASLGVSWKPGAPSTPVVPRSWAFFAG